MVLGEDAGNSFRRDVAQDKIPVFVHDRYTVTHIVENELQNVRMASGRWKFS